MVYRGEYVDPERPEGDGPAVPLPELNLWLGVLERAVLDARRPVACNKYRASDAVFARRWLTDPKLHGWVLRMCGIEPDYWRRVAMPRLAERWAEVDARDIQLDPENEVIAA